MSYFIGHNVLLYINAFGDICTCTWKNSDEYICSSDLTTCVHDTETASGTENKMEEPPPPPPALMMLLQNIMDNTNTVHEQTTDYEYCLLYQ